MLLGGVLLYNNFLSMNPAQKSLFFRRGARMRCRRSWTSFSDNPGDLDAPPPLVEVIWRVTLLPSSVSAGFRRSNTNEGEESINPRSTIEEANSLKQDTGEMSPASAYDRLPCTLGLCLNYA
jgi:hypothetical protein